MADSTNDCFVVIDKTSGEWIGDEGYLPDDLERLKAALADNGSCYVQFRQGRKCTFFSYREAYDLAVSHPQDSFELTDYVWNGVDLTASMFISLRIFGNLDEKENPAEAQKEDIFSRYDGWNDQMDSFVWDHVLDEKAAIAICERFVIAL